MQTQQSFWSDRRRQQLSQQPHHQERPQVHRLRPSHHLRPQPPGIQLHRRSRHRFGLGNDGVTIILVRYCARGFDSQHIRRQTINKLEHRFPPLMIASETIHPASMKAAVQATQDYKRLIGISP
jgi:hypothetical protein